MKESGRRTLLFSSRSLYNVIEDENSLFLFFLPHHSCCIPLSILITRHCLVGTRVNCFSYAFRNFLEGFLFPFFGFGYGNHEDESFNLTKKITFHHGHNTLDILSMMIGLQNNGPWFDVRILNLMLIILTS
ncbi:hypothetical protein ACJW30_05G055000 [Castanea mollissima]